MLKHLTVSHSLKFSCLKSIIGGGVGTWVNPIWNSHSVLSVHALLFMIFSLYNECLAKYISFVKQSIPLIKSYLLAVIGLIAKHAGCHNLSKL